MQHTNTINTFSFTEVPPDSSGCACYFKGVPCNPSNPVGKFYLNPLKTFTQATIFCMSQAVCQSAIQGTNSFSFHPFQHHQSVILVGPTSNALGVATNTSPTKSLGMRPGVTAWRRVLEVTLPRSPTWRPTDSWQLLRVPELGSEQAWTIKGGPGPGAMARLGAGSIGCGGNQMMNLGEKTI